MGRATATVLFTDLVASTELRGRLGEEAAEELRRRHDRLLAEAVEQHGGRVVKGLGDGIMAVFTGAADAVAAAVVIQQAVDRLNRSEKPPVPLALRVGLSSGDVTFEDGDVHGTPVIEASRLCAAAAPGDVLLAEVVRVLSGQVDEEFVDRGALELKGLQKPVAAWAVRWEPAATPAIPMPVLLTDVGRIFVGRDADLQRLLQLWDEAAAGDRRVAFLAGEPGIGKTRLAAEVAIRVHEDGGIVLAGRCDEDLGVPYQPFVQALRYFVDHVPPEQLAARLGRYGGELVRLVPELAERLPDLPPPVRSDPETERYRLFDALVAWLAAASAEEPVLLVLDDLQWAAKPTLLLLRHILLAPESGSVFILATYRDTELRPDHPLVQVLADLRRQGGVERIALVGLDGGGVAAFVRQAAGHDLDDEALALARAVHGETDGNPFFVKEVLRHLVETGAVEERAGRWGSRLPVDALAIPEGVREVVGRRLARLSDEANEALRLAAVVGADFTFRLVARAGHIDEDALVSALDEAINARLISEAGGDHLYRFAHALVRDTLYGQLSAGRRRILHRRVAEAIEAAHGGRLDDQLQPLAHHYQRACDDERPEPDVVARAVRYLRQAADQARAAAAFEEAADLYERALDVAGRMPDADPALVCDLRTACGEALYRSTSPRYRRVLDLAADDARKLRDAGRLARVVLAGHPSGMSSAIGERNEEILGLLREALDALDASEHGLRARLLAVLGCELQYTNDTSKDDLLREAIAMARSADDRATLAAVLSSACYSMADPHAWDERLAAARDLLTVSTELGDPESTFWGHLHCYDTLVEGADLDEARLHLGQAARLADDLHQALHRWRVATRRAGELAVAGRLEEAQEGVLTARADAAALHRSLVGVSTVQAYAIQRDQGRLTELAPDLEERLHAQPDQYLWYPILANVQLDGGRASEARATFERGMTLFSRALRSGRPWLICLCILGDLAVKLDERDAAGVLYDDLLAVPGRIAGVFASAPFTFTDHVLAVLAGGLGRFDDAERHFAAAAELARRAGAPIWLARTEAEWARMLTNRRRPGDAERARELLDDALATARQLGAGGVERLAVGVGEASG